MPFFKYLGEVPRPFVADYGPTKKIEIPTQSGEPTVLEDPDGFPVDEALPFDFTDQISLLILRADPRFSEIE